MVRIILPLMYTCRYDPLQVLSAAPDCIV
jgi:hypothetical protein